MNSLILNMFDQFAPPSFIGIPLFAIATLIPWLLMTHPNNFKWTNNRLYTIQYWFLKKCAKELLTPIKKHVHRWALMLVSLMTFLLTMNLLGLLPYTFTPTTQLSMNLALALPIWFGTALLGYRKQTRHALAHFLPEGTPTPLIPALIIIETVSVLIRPLALGVRITANLTAGHLLIHLTSTAALAISSAPLSVLVFFLLILLTILEIAVAVIQAYVFVLLLSLYLEENARSYKVTPFRALLTSLHLLKKD